MFKRFFALLNPFRKDISTRDVTNLYEYDPKKLQDLQMKLGEALFVKIFEASQKNPKGSMIQVTRYPDNAGVFVIFAQIPLTSKSEGENPSSELALQAEIRIAKLENRSKLETLELRRRAARHFNNVVEEQQIAQEIHAILRQDLHKAFYIFYRMGNDRFYDIDEFDRFIEVCQKEARDHVFL